MKYLFPLLLIFISFDSVAQKFIVQCEDKSSKEIVEAKVSSLGYIITDKNDSADYSLKCTIWNTSKINSMYKGRIDIIDRQGNVILKSEEVRRGAVAVNGFNASSNIFGVISKKFLPQLLGTIKANYGSR